MSMCCCHRLAERIFNRFLTKSRTQQLFYSQVTHHLESWMTSEFFLKHKSGSEPKQMKTGGFWCIFEQCSNTSLAGSRSHVQCYGVWSLELLCLYIWLLEITIWTAKVNNALQINQFNTTSKPVIQTLEYFNSREWITGELFTFMHLLDAFIQSDL